MTKLSDDELNKRIHELMGLCWHDKVGSKHDFKCAKCPKFLPTGKAFTVYERSDYYIDFTTSWEAFGLLWEWLQKHELWEEFCEWYDIDGHPSLYTIDLISPPILSRAVVEFFEAPHE